MNHKLLVRVTAPAVATGLLLFTACLAGVRYISRLQAGLADVLAEDVTSLQAAQELEIRVRQLRFHSLLYLMDPSPARLTPIETDQRGFEEALGLARRAAGTPRERACVQAIEAGYEQYQTEQTRLRTAAPAKPAAEFHQVADSHPIRHVVEPCQELLRLNKEKMERVAEESRRVSRQGNWAMLVLGLAGPVGGIVLGYGVARGLRQSLYQLSVRVQDMAQHLGRDVASVSLEADGDIQGLDRQMQKIVRGVEEVAERVRQQQRQLVRAEQLSAAGRLAAGVAHEVRNPLTGIKMLVEAAVRPRSPRPLDAEDLRVIHGEVVRLEQVVQSFLDFARLPAPQRSLCDLRELAARARDLVRTRAEQQHVELALHCPDGPVRASVDGGQLATVLVNLFLNALDAMPSGGRIDVTVGVTPDGASRIAVADTGTGIPPQVVDRLFTPFTTTKPTGTGLGLSIASRILEEHGGTVTARNRPEGGASFTVTLPPPPEGDHAQPAGDRR